MEAKEYLLTEVEKHNKKNDCWIIIDDNVCDVTKFLEEHPGGADILLTCAGKDCTDEFKEICHSDDAYKLVKEHKIGKYNTINNKSNN